MLEIDFQPGLERVRETSRPLCARQMSSPGDCHQSHDDSDEFVVDDDDDDDHLLASFNVPEDTRHVAAGGEDLIVVQEPDKTKIRFEKSPRFLIGRII